MTEDGIRLIETTNVTDVYADGVAAVEVLGETVRVIFFTYRTPPGWKIGTKRERVVVAKIVRPINSYHPGKLAAMIEAQASAIAGAPAH